MAEEVASALVSQTDHEKMVSKLQNMILNNLTAKQQKDLSKHRAYFIEHFIELSYILFGLSRNQLREFSDNELIMLEKLIRRKAKLRAIISQVFIFGIPIFGWIIGMICDEEGELHSWSYLHHGKYLKKAHGKDYFPFHELKLGL